MSVKSIPEGFHTVSAYLIVKDAPQAMGFYKKAFGAEESLQLNDPTSGQFLHGEMKMGDSIFMMGEEMPGMEMQSPQSLGGSSMGIHLYLEDVDAQLKQAVEAGAEIIRPLKDEFYGDRSVTVKDPFGHFWTLATHTEDVTGEEIQKRLSEMQGGA